MVTHAFVEIDIPEAADLAHYTGIKHDLETAREFAHTFQVEFVRRPPNGVLLDALSTAVLIRYARPFSKGVRRWLDESDLAVFTPEQRERHKLLIAIRDKHVAHSVNAFEESRPQARYVAERVKSEGVTSIECSHHRVVGLSSEELNGIIELTTTMLTHVEARLVEEKKKILAIVRQKKLCEVQANWSAELVTSDPTRRRPV